jgi:hypothetical protein
MSHETSAALTVAGVGHLEKHTSEVEMRTVVQRKYRKRDRRVRQLAAHWEASLFSLNFAFSLAPAADAGRFGIDFSKIVVRCLYLYQVWYTSCQGRRALFGCSSLIASHRHGRTVAGSNRGAWALERSGR